MPYLNLGCLHLLPLITELYFWTIDNQYTSSKTSECYKINLWLELAYWKAETSRKRKIKSWSHVREALVLETRKKFHGSGIWNLSFMVFIKSTANAAGLDPFFFLLLSSNVQEIVKERSLKQVLPKYPFLKNHNCLFKQAWWTTYASYARRPNCLVYLHF